MRHEDRLNERREIIICYELTGSQLLGLQNSQQKALKIVNFQINNIKSILFCLLINSQILISNYQKLNRIFQILYFNKSTLNLIFFIKAYSLDPNKKSMNHVREMRKVSFFSKSYNFNFKLQFPFASTQTRMEFTKKLLQGRYYQILGFSRDIDDNLLTESNIKRRYFAMVKKYHSDGVIDPLQKVDNEEITKCIIRAYEEIVKHRIRQQNDKEAYQNIYNDEDGIAMKLFGKKFNEIKYHLFNQENTAKRAKFMEQLQKIRKHSKNYQHYKSKQQQYSSDFNNYSQRATYQQPLKAKFSQNFGRKILKIIIPIGGAVAVLSYFYLNIKAVQDKAHIQQRKKQKLTLSPDQLKTIQRKSIQAYERKLNNLITSFTQQQPPSLKYPAKKDPQQIDQLIQYTIGPDINLYEVSSALLAHLQSLDKFKQIRTMEQVKVLFGSEFDPYPLNKIKVNSAISLSLQAQRCLQNIYIKVKDVADEIQRSGKYTPPTIFFRFYGYIMFQIRQKPLSLSNYRDTEYISLFDLFFDYYSPIPLKRHQYNQYVVGLYDEDLKMYGQVHLNHRKIPQRYITRNDKVVVMRDNVASEEQKYEYIWQNFYKRYMKIWRRGYPDRIYTERL